ncbi:MAG: FAD-binding oxidoreductase, partial [Dehalococcoidia bacterium]
MRRPSLARVVFATSATAAMVGAVAAPLLSSGSKRGQAGPPKISSWRRRITSHETFTHDSLDILGYDWERVGNPAIEPKYPLKIYLPQTTEDIVRIVKDARTLGEKLSIRSKGHSSNDLVLTDGGAVIVTEKLNRLVELNEDEMTATVQAGTVSAELDDWLAERGYGLPIIGDHNHITVGGFASVGGISPASHRFGLFLDNVVRLEYVTWDGDIVSCSPTHHPDQFYKVLAGMGKQGVMATLTCKIITIDKYGTVLENDQTHYRNVDDFIKGSGRYIVDPGDALMERGVWIDFEMPGGRTLKLGQFSAYKETEQSRYKSARNRVSYGYLHRIGYVAGRLPAKVDRVAKFVGTSGVLFSPKFATIKNIEFFTDKILDSTVGDPTRMI